MPKSKEGQARINGTDISSGGEKGRGSGRSGNSNNNSDTTRHTNGNSEQGVATRSETNTTGNCQNEGSSELQSPLNLGPFTAAAHVTIEQLFEAIKAIRSLSEPFTTYVNDIEKSEAIQQRSKELENNCRVKDEEINLFKETIKGLTRAIEDEKKDIAIKMEEIEKDAKKLEAEKNKFNKTKETAEKRMKVMEVEHKNAQDKEFERIRKEFEDECQILREKLVQDIKKQADENRKKLTDLEADNQKLSKQLEKQRSQCRDLETNLAKTQEALDDQKTVKDAVKREKLELEERLRVLENEFTLSAHKKEFYEEKFQEISKMIEAISTQYFTKLPDQEIKTIQKKLVDADYTFASVPISASEESQKLRMAHAQRIISSSLYQFIWQPFSSEKTMKHQDSILFLSEIATELAKLSQEGKTSRRSAYVWRALTMLGIGSLSPASPSPSSTPYKSPSSQGDISLSPKRASKTISKIISVLSPLINSSQETALRKELRALVDSAISIWNDAQADELNITICNILESENRNEWRSQVFDPLPSPSTATEEKDSDIAVEGVDIKSKTRPRIFTLFPRIVAQKFTLSAPAEANSNKPRLPGSWHDDTDHEHSQQQLLEKLPTVETETYIIHTGTGLPEWSALVLRGKNEEEETRRWYDEEMRMLEAKRRSGGAGNVGSRRESLAGSESGGPLSPTEQWASGGGMKIVEE